jgi:ubiquinone/menaquinone biosynthesis C-methylase UbiE
MDEAKVVGHYSQGNLAERLLAGIRAAGFDDGAFQARDLGGADQFHIDAVEASERLARAAGIGPESAVLDLGSGIGGPARLFADRFGATVTGVDLTPEFVEVATDLTARTGLADRVSFVLGSALDLPFGDGRFDVATMLHVGMNIADKPEVFAEVARVLKPEGIFAVYDIMAVGAGEPNFPLPWAATPDISFVLTPVGYTEELQEAGFEIVQERNYLSPAMDFLARTQAAAAAGPPPLGLHLVLGADGGRRMGNLREAFAAGTLAPVQIIARRR